MSTVIHKRNTSQQLQRGAVSIFAVIFSMLLITVVTVSFVRLMIREQQQASAADLSQSAYDSALAGVEDAKRLLVFCQGAANPTAYPECVDLASKTCTESLSAVRTATGVDAAENPVQAGAGANEFEQAYTCLKINPTPVDYVGRLDKDQSNIIALSSASGQAAPKEITIEWMTKQDFSGDELKVPSLASYSSAATSYGGLPGVSAWSAAKWPAAMQVQRIANTATDPISGTTDSPTIAWNNKMSLSNDNSQLLLLPTRTTATSAVTEKAFPVERVTPYSTGSAVEAYGFAGCQASATTTPSEYYCSMKIPFSTASSVTLFKIMPLYRGAHYRITMKDESGNQLLFSGVQAVVDATGRASDVFRRVEARIDMASVAPYPDAAVETKSSLCKTMFVTNDTADYSTPGCS